MVVKVPAPFHYASGKAVPWNYTSRIVAPKPQAITEQMSEQSINDIAGTGGMTRSEWCYAPVTIEVGEGESSAENGGVK